MPGRMGCWLTTACRCASFTGSARASFTGAPCAAGCVAGPGPVPIARGPGSPPEFAEEANINWVWGTNAAVSNVHLVRCIRRAKRKGGRLVVVDPLRTKIAEQADLHLQILPGTDTPLAWAIAAELERAGAFDNGFIAANMLGFDDFMVRAREWTTARAASLCG